MNPNAPHAWAERAMTDAELAQHAGAWALAAEHWHIAAAYERIALTTVGASRPRTRVILAESACECARRGRVAARQATALLEPR